MPAVARAVKPATFSVLSAKRTNYSEGRKTPGLVTDAVERLRQGRHLMEGGTSSCRARRATCGIVRGRRSQRRLRARDRPAESAQVLSVTPHHIRRTLSNTR